MNAPTAKGQRTLKFSVFFYTPCPARYSVLHLLGVLSGGNAPPLCKQVASNLGGGSRKRDGGIVKTKFIRQTIPQPPSASAPFIQGNLWFVRPENPSIFLTSTAFVDTKVMHILIEWTNSQIYDIMIKKFQTILKSTQ